MKDTCGPTSSAPLAQYDRDTQSWKTCEATSLWALTLSSLTLPTWGCLRDGVLYALPMPEHPIGERAYSSLPTPTARDHKDHQVEVAKWRPNHKDTLNRALAHLLPTPAVNDMGAGKDPKAWQEWAARQKASDGRPAPHGKSLEQEALSLGAHTAPPLSDGQPSWDDLLQPLPFDETTATD